MRRLTAALMLALTLSLGGCATLNPPTTQECTLFGCQEDGNIIQELGGMVLVMGIITGALAAVARRMSK